MHCYRKSHLRQIGLTIATTCDLNALVQELGSVLGGAIFAQSRKPSEEPSRLWGRPRPAITLACSAGGSYPAPVDLDDMPGERVCPDSAMPRRRSTIRASANGRFLLDMTAPPSRGFFVGTARFDEWRDTVEKMLQMR